MPFLQGRLTPDNQVIPPFGKAINISAAQIQALNTAPVTIIPAPGPNMAVSVNGMVIEVNRGATAFTGGGAIGPVYQGATGTFLTSNQMAASDVTGAAGQTTRLLTAANAAGGTALTPNTAVQLFAGTGNFAAGNGTMKVHVNYSLISL